jgi:hypothetical protein
LTIAHFNFIYKGYQASQVVLTDPLQFLKLFISALNIEAYITIDAVQPLPYAFICIGLSNKYSLDTFKGCALQTSLKGISPLFIAVVFHLTKPPPHSPELGPLSPVTSKHRGW